MAMKAIRVLIGQPSVIEGCLLLHYKVYATKAEFDADEPTKYETVCSQLGDFTIGNITAWYDSEFPMKVGKKRLVDEFLAKKHRHRQATRALVKAEIMSGAGAA